MKPFKAILTLTAALFFGGFSYAAPITRNLMPLMRPTITTRTPVTASGGSVMVLMIPLGDQALCAAGIAMPDCALDPYQPRYWLEIIEINGVVFSEKIIAGTD